MRKEVKDKSISTDEWEGAIKDLILPNVLVRAYIRRNKKVYISGKRATAGMVYVDKELGGMTGTLIFIPDTDEEGIFNIF